MFGETIVRHIEPVLRALFASERPDLVVHEVLDIGAALAAERHGVRAIAFGLGLWNPMLASCVRAGAARRPTLPGGYLDPMPASVQNPVPLPAQPLPIRPVPWAPAPSRCRRGRRPAAAACT